MAVALCADLGGDEDCEEERGTASISSRPLNLEGAVKNHTRASPLLQPLFWSFSTGWRGPLVPVMRNVHHLVPVGINYIY